MIKGNKYRTLMLETIAKYNHGNGHQHSPATWYDNLPIEDKRGLLDELDTLLREYREVKNKNAEEISDECEMAFTFISLITDEDRVAE